MMARSLVRKYSSGFHCSIISTEDLIGHLSSYPAEQQPVLVDVRSCAERHTSYIPDSCTKAQFEKYCFEKNADDGVVYPKAEFRNREIVPYCTIGYRSAEYCSYLRRIGFSNVMNGEGIVVWTHFADPESRFGLVREEMDATVQSIDEVNTFSSKFDFASEKYRTVHCSFLEVAGVGLSRILGL